MKCQFISYNGGMGRNGDKFYFVVKYICCMQMDEVAVTTGFFL